MTIKSTSINVRGLTSGKISDISIVSKLVGQNLNITKNLITFTPLLEKPLIKILPFGDSFTDNGDSNRLANGSYSISTAGYWGCTWALTKQDFEMLDGKGVTGNTTTDLLNRITDATLSEADVVLLLCGTNDLNAGRSPESARDGMQQILDQLITAGKKILLVPVAYRRASDGLNTKIDTLNEYYKLLAEERKTHVVIASSSSLFNSLSEADSRQVTTDGLHPTGYGAILIAKEVVKTLDKYFISEQTNRTNYAPNPTFSGTSGTLLSGATGTVPNDWRVYFGDPTNDGVGTGVGSTVNNDGSVTLRTGNNTSISNGTRVLLRTGDIIIPQGGKWRYELEVDCESMGNATEHKIYITSNDVNVGIVEFQGSRFTSEVKFEKFKMKTPYIDVKTATKLQVYYQIVTSGGGSITATVRNPRLVKQTE
ncbi:hypothetical protein [Vibrio phage JSF13]|nr:hypothetical protein [Vibrio phage JSF13]QVV99980.1 hypothetical protein 2017DhaAA_0525 [Vibrio phage ICP1]